MVDVAAIHGAQMMKTMDIDNSGQIDYMEFVAATMSAYQMSHGLSPAHQAAWLNRVRIVFDKIDEDGNGYITQEARRLSPLPPAAGARSALTAWSCLLSCGATSQRDYVTRLRVGMHAGACQDDWRHRRRAHNDCRG